MLSLQFCVLASLLHTIQCSIATGTSFYKVNLGRCLTITPNAVYNDMKNQASCLTQCLMNPWCATYQYYTSNQTCNLYSQVSYDEFWYNSINDDCQLYNMKCTGSQYAYYNFSAIYSPTGSNWTYASDYCKNNRMSLAQLSTSSILSYIASLVCNNCIYWVGGYRPSTGASFRWIGDSSPLGVSLIGAMSSGLCPYTSVQNCVALVKVSGYTTGLYNAHCDNCGFTFFCQCNEWGLI